MEQVVIESLIRKASGKSGARAVRRQGSIPAIFYGPEAKPIAIQVSKRDLEKTFKQQASENTIYQLNIKGNGQDLTKTVMVKDLQKSPVAQEILHVDFYEVSMFKEIDVTVSLKMVGKAAGVEKGGILQETSRELEIRCLPTHIPDYIEVDVSALDIGDSIHVESIQLPEGIRVLSDPHLTLVTVVPPTEEKPAVEEPEEEAEVEVAAKKGKTKDEAEG